MKDFFSISKQQFWIATIVSVCVIIVAACYGWMASGESARDEEYGNQASDTVSARDLQEEKAQENPKAEDLQKINENTDESSKNSNEDIKPSDNNVISSSGEFSIPVEGDIFRNYSTTELSYYPTLGQYMVHYGIDIKTVEGTEVAAAADGLVSKIFDDKKMGRTVWLSHEGEVTTVYSNLQEEVSVEEGDVVVKGQTIGKSGNTSLIEKNDEPHVHIEVLLNGEAVNPADYFNLGR